MDAVEAALGNAAVLQIVAVLRSVTALRIAAVLRIVAVLRGKAPTLTAVLVVAEFEQRTRTYALEGGE